MSKGEEACMASVTSWRFGSGGSILSRFCFLCILSAAVTISYVIVISPIPTVLSYLPQRNTLPTALCKCLDDVNSELQNTTSENQTTSKNGTFSHLIPSNDTIKAKCVNDVNSKLQNTSQNQTTSKNGTFSHLIPRNDTIKCFDDVNSKLQNTTSHDQTTPTNGLFSHLIPQNGTKNDTIKLWKFKDVDDQQLYLYENLLKRNWTANLTIMETLRQKLAKYRSELEDRSQIILHQGNTKMKQKINFVFHNHVSAMPNSIFKRLPKTNPFSQETRYRSCAVVGNSGIMLNSSCGKDVDKHDYVFRCNLAPILPFKEDAGMKSNLTTMNPSLVTRRYKGLHKSDSIKRYSQDISQYDGMLWIPCFGYSGDMYHIQRAFSSFKGKKPKIVCGNPQHFKSVLDFWQERELNNPISTGFYLVTTAIQLCDEVQLYGFWPFSARYGDTMSDVPYHYFDDLSADRAKTDHLMNEEFNLLVQLHTLGILRINVGSCS